MCGTSRPGVLESPSVVIGKCSSCNEGSIVTVNGATTDQRSASAAGVTTVGRPRSGGWTVIPLALVVLMLLGSVLIPAGLTWRILHLLRDITEVIEPARLIGAQLEAGLEEESAALQAYALSGDSALVARYRAAAVDDEGRLIAVARLARRLDRGAVDRVAAVQRRTNEWRQGNRALVEGRIPRAQVVAVVRAQRAGYDSTRRVLARLSSYLAVAGAV